MLNHLWGVWKKDIWRGPNTNVLDLFVFLLLYTPNMLLMGLGLSFFNFKSIGMFVSVKPDYEVTYFYYWSEFLNRKIDLFRVFGDGYAIRRQLVE